MKPRVTFERLIEVLDYDASTGIFTWKKELSNQAPIGSRAGTVSQEGYIHIAIDRVVFGASRLAWLYVYGQYPVKQIDHINLNKLDDRIANLRLATNQQNLANRPVLRNNVSGFKGVNERRYKGVRGRDWVRYRARIRVNNQLIQIGQFKTPEEANAAYEAAAKLHFGEFARAR